MRRALPWLLPALTACAALGCGPLEGLELGLQHTAITGGQAHEGHPAVGRLQVGSDQMCTGTLVGSKTVLSAAHCLKDPSIILTLDNGTAIPVVEAVKHPSHEKDGDPYDIAVLTLRSAPELEPILVATEPPTPDQPITLIGYGTTACQQAVVDGQPTVVCEDADGVKRIADNTVDTVTDLEFTFTGLGNTCKGDSGGPALAEQGGIEVVLGVTSRGDMPCGTRGYDTRVDVFVPWLEEVSAGDVRTDAQPPEVSIAEPQSGAQLASGSIAVRAAVEDDSGEVASVELTVDGQAAGRRDLADAQYTTFTVELDPGSHRLTVIAADADGNRAEDTVEVVVLAAEEKPLDGPCTGEQCDPVRATDTEQSTLVGGCTIGHATEPPAAIALWPLLLLFVSRRRRPNPS